MVQLIIYDSGSTKLNNTPTLILLLTKNEMNFVKSLRQFEVKLKQKKKRFYLLILIFILVCS